MSKINIAIKIPDEWYAGFKKSFDGLPMVYMTPQGKDKASQNRVNSIQRYSGGEKGIPDTVLNNKPLCGFKILQYAHGGYNTGQVVWRVEDPRGFQTDIPSGNLNQLLALTTIDQGEILESCVWARDGKYNVLLPTNSEEYKVAVKNTELTKQSVRVTDVKIGNIVNLKNGMRDMTYLGKYQKLCGLNGDYGRFYEQDSKIVQEQPRYYFMTAENVIYHYVSANIAEVTDANAVMENTEAENLVNGKLVDRVLMSQKPQLGDNFKINLIPFDLYGFAKSGQTEHKSFIMAKFVDGSMGVINYVNISNHRWNQHKHGDLQFEIINQNDLVTKGEIRIRQEHVPNRHRGFGAATYKQNVRTMINVFVPDNTTFYEVEIEWTNDNGTFTKKLART